MTKREVEESIDFNVHTDSIDSETGSTILDLHFHGWNCLFEYIENITEEDLEKHHCWNIWAHDVEAVRHLRNILLRARE